MTNEELLKKFIEWLDNQKIPMCIAGPVRSNLLGTYQLQALHEDDYDEMIKDFLESLVIH